MSPTPMFHALAATAEMIRPAIVMVDSVAGVFGGNQNDCVQVRSFISLLRKSRSERARRTCSAPHPTGITAGTGRGGSIDCKTRCALGCTCVRSRTTVPSANSK